MTESEKLAVATEVMEELYTDAINEKLAHPENALVSLKERSLRIACWVLNERRQLGEVAA